MMARQNAGEFEANDCRAQRGESTNSRYQCLGLQGCALRLNCMFRAMRRLFFCPRPHRRTCVPLSTICGGGAASN